METILTEWATGPVCFWDPVGPRESSLICRARYLLQALESQPLYPKAAMGAGLLSREKGVSLSERHDLNYNGRLKCPFGFIPFSTLDTLLLCQLTRIRCRRTHPHKHPRLEANRWAVRCPKTCLISERVPEDASQSCWCPTGTGSAS